MKTKKCIHCGEEKTLEMFYRHPQMLDGYLNKCKECTKKENKENRNMKIEYYRQYDRERGCTEKRKKARKEYEIKMKTFNPDLFQKRKNIANQKWRNKHKDRTKAERLLDYAVKYGKLIKPEKCIKCGLKTENLQAHHFDYTKPLEVWWLCSSCHAQEHVRKREEQRKNAV